MRRRLLLAVTTLLVLAGCSAESETLVIYSGRSEELVQPLIEQFEAESGIDVEVRYAGSTDHAATLLEEGDSTDADVFFAQDPASLGAVGDLLSELPADLLDRVESRFSDTNGKWVGVSGRVRTFIYDRDANIELPQSIDDVVDERWAGQLGVAPTNGSFLAFVAAMILERGEEATLEWLEALAANDPQTFDGNSPIVASTDNGEIQGGLVNHYYVLRLRAEGAGQVAENHFIPAGDVGSLVMPAGAGIIAGTESREDAEEFIRFLLSEEAQSYFATETFEFPMIEGVPSPEGLPDLAEIITPDIDLSRLADVLDDATRLVSEAGLV